MLRAAWFTTCMSLYAAQACCLVPLLLFLACPGAVSASASPQPAGVRSGTCKPQGWLVANPQAAQGSLYSLHCQTGCFAARLNALGGDADGRSEAFNGTCLIHMRAFEDGTGTCSVSVYNGDSWRMPESMHIRGSCRVGCLGEAREFRCCPEEGDAGQASCFRQLGRGLPGTLSALRCEACAACMLSICAPCILADVRREGCCWMIALHQTLHTYNKAVHAPGVCGALVNAETCVHAMLSRAWQSACLWRRHVWAFEPTSGRLTAYSWCQALETMPALVSSAPRTKAANRAGASGRMQRGAAVMAPMADAHLRQRQSGQSAAQIPKTVSMTTNAALPPCVHHLLVVR